MRDGKFELNDIRIEPLSKLFDISSFDCDDEDLNDFLKVDSFRYKDQKLAETILVICGDKVIGFFSLCTDAIKLSECETLDCEGILRLQEFPSVKIARRGVIKDYHKKGLGSLIIKIVLGLIRNCLGDNIGCRFITVDAYNSKVDFYRKFGFQINEHSKYKRKEEYVSMRFDIFNK